MSKCVNLELYKLLMESENHINIHYPTKSKEYREKFNVYCCLDFHNLEKFSEIIYNDYLDCTIHGNGNYLTFDIM